MTAPTGEVERVAAALDECVICGPDSVTPDLLDDAAKLLRSLAKDAARLELALATERGKLEKADAVADAWARDGARYAYVRNQKGLLTISMEVRQYAPSGSWPLYGEDLDKEIDMAIEAAGRKEGGGG
jgi:hypothetical protein